jgi:hypothetical protein
MKTDAIAQYGRGVSSQIAIEYASIAAAKVFSAKTRAECRTQNDEGCWFMTIIRFWKSADSLFQERANRPRSAADIAARTFKPRPGRPERPM